MKTTMRKSQSDSLWVILHGFLLLLISYLLFVLGSEDSAWRSTSYLLPLFGLPIWIYGFMKYTRSKGWSGLLGIALSALGPFGLVILFLLQDLYAKQPASRTTKRPARAKVSKTAKTRKAPAKRK